MAKHYHVRGINPMGRVVELVIVEDYAEAAKVKAEETGLRFVIVSEEPPLLKDFKFDEYDSAGSD